MLLLRDENVRAAASQRLDQHLAVVSDTLAGRQDLRALHAEKLEATLSAASRSELYASALAGRASLSIAAEGVPDPELLLDQVLPTLPLLSKHDLGGQRNGHSALVRRPAEFLHYYESSGTTSEPVAAPKALDDLVANTANIGEMWGRLLGTGDVALILIIGPLAPAPYQFEKVMEYLGLMSFRPWVDYIDGDYTKVLRLIDELSVNVFIGAPSRLLAMIQFAFRNGIRPPRFEHLLLVAEQTGPSFLRHLERLTGATAYVGSYGSSETGTIAVSCECGRLHLQLQSYILELHDHRGTRMVDGRSDRGELVVTTLDLLGRPLLRYRTGDLVQIDPDPCECGIALPVMRTQGREQDVLAMPGGVVRQDELESGLWDDPLPGPAVLNYMLLVRGAEIVVLVTTDRPADEEWAQDLADRLEALFPAERLMVRAVEVLSPLASLSGDLGWKLSRVLDLGNERMWERVPPPIAAVVRDAFDELATV